MEKAIKKLILDRINNGSENHYPETKVVAIEDGEDIKVMPAPSNKGHAFYHHEVLADIERAFCVHSLLRIEDEKIIAIIWSD
jgi:hypothetical protein